MTQVGAPDGRRSSTPAAPVMIDIEALPDPYVLYESVRDESGRIIDFRFAAVNAAAVADFGLAREQLLSSTLLNLHPLTGDGILFDDFVHAVDSGEPLILEDFENPSTPPKGDRRFYDISANRVGDGLGVSWWDVTQRYRSDRAVAKAEMRWRSTLESLLDPLQVLSPVRRRDR
jgi:PAS domain-containing protein